MTLLEWVIKLETTGKINIKEQTKIRKFLSTTMFNEFLYQRPYVVFYNQDKGEQFEFYKVTKLCLYE